MPKTLYYFAVGGTGALSVEPLLLCCAAGIGPARVSLSLIDPDGGNPAFTRAFRLIKAYSDTRKAFGNPATGFFSTELVRTERSEAVWSPVTEGGATLEEFVGRGRMTGQNADAGALLDLLFSPEQQVEELREGFRGNPAIGSIMMYGLKHSRYFRELLAGARGDKDACFFATGSIFGGTGASGLPVVAELLAQEGIKLQQIGAAIVTPYYALKDPAASEAARLRPDSELFLRNTAAALPTYTQGRSKYGALYYLGDAESLAVPRSVYSAGGADQRNDPHMIELYAALAALHFTRTADDADDADEARHYYVTVGSTSSEKPAYSWEHLPVSERERSELIAFAVAANFFLQYFGSKRSGSREQELISELGDQVWLNHIGLRPDFVRSHAKSLDALGSYFAAVWEYLWGVSLNYVPLYVTGFDPDAKGSVTIQAPLEYARPHTQRTSEITLPRVDDCVHNKPPRRKKIMGIRTGSADQLTSSAEMFHWYNQVRNESVKDLLGFLAYMHDGTVKFLHEWYNIRAQ